MQSHFMFVRTVLWLMIRLICVLYIRAMGNSGGNRGKCGNICGSGVDGQIWGAGGEE
jgi:uncharacterized membrane protein